MNFTPLTPSEQLAWTRYLNEPLAHLPVEDLLSGSRLAKKLDVDPATVRRWVREGAPHHVLGDNLIRFKFEELLAWRAQHKRK